jgi:hypothetical protein
MIEETSHEDDENLQRFTATVHLDQRSRSLAPDVSSTWTDDDIARELAAFEAIGMNRQMPDSQAQQHRVTRVSLHPADVAASHAADGIATALSSGFESAVMRTVARSFLLRQGASPAAVERAVFQPSEVGGNAGLVAKALAGEWGLMWLLFEGSYFASTWIGIRWFGYVTSSYYDR